MALARSPSHAPAARDDRLCGLLTADLHISRKEFHQLIVDRSDKLGRIGRRDRSRHRRNPELVRNCRLDPNLADRLDPLVESRNLAIERTRPGPCRLRRRQRPVSLVENIGLAGRRAQPLLANLDPEPSPLQLCLGTVESMKFLYLNLHRSRRVGDEAGETGTRRTDRCDSLLVAS